MDNSGTYSTPCPTCGGTVEWWWYSSDCRGNPGGSGIHCTKCKRNFSRKEWESVELDPRPQEEPGSGG